MDDRSRLLEALEGAFGVRFEARERDSWRGVDAGLVFVGPEDLSPFSREPPVPCLVARQPSPDRRERRALVVFERVARLDARLRGRALPDARAGGLAPLPTDDGEEVLASADGAPVWTRLPRAEGALDVIALAPEELGAEHALRDLMRPGRFVSLLPLVAFLRQIAAPIAWTPPRPRASLILDDPNLHWPSYGYVRYPKLAEHARAHGYHVAMAMIPLDAGLTHPAAVRTFLRERRVLSLVVHGNDHLHHELAAPLDDREVTALLSQALRRVTAFERRTGLEVARIMVPPHERCSEAMARHLVPSGFDALCSTRPYPWQEAPPKHRPLAGWGAGDLVLDGLPVLPRYHLHHPREELVLRAFLDQPLILFGHHTDAAGGLDAFAQAALDVKTATPAEWMAPRDIAHSNLATRRDGEVLAIRPYSRRVSLEVPDGVSFLRLETPEIDAPVSWRVTFGESIRDGPVSVRTGSGPEAISVPFAGTITVELASPVASAPPLGRRLRPKVRPMARRMLTETRDRLLPAFDRAVSRSPVP